MHRTLQEYLRALESRGELRRVSAEVSPVLEVSEIVDRLSKSPCPTVSEAARSFDPDHCGLGGQAVLFENVAGCDFPLLMNAFGSYHRMELALGCVGPRGFESIADRIASLTNPQPPGSLGDLVSAARRMLPLLRIPPKRVKRGMCQEVVRLTERDEVDLTRLPLIKCWPLDGDPLAVGSTLTAEQSGTAGGDGRYITIAGMHTVHADDRDARKPASHNIGMYRAQLLDSTHLAMHWHIHHDGAAHWRSWKKLGRPMPIAICFGGESVLPYAATSPLPPGISELLMAGFLNGRGIRLVRGKTVPLWVPANSEIVIEGFVSTECGQIGYDPRPGHEGDPAEPLGPGAVFEGPFGDHTGFYSLPDRYPIMNVTAITHRRNAIFPAIIVGLPPQEDYAMGKATERIFRPLLNTLIPDLDDYHLPMFGCFHNCAFIGIGKAYALQARRVMHAVWGAGQMAWTKYIIVVDDDVDVHNQAAVLRAVFERCDFLRDVELVNGPLDILDHAASRLGAGHKLGIDATTKRPGEEAAGVSVADRPRPLQRPQSGLIDGLRTHLSGRAGITSISIPDFGGGRCVFISIDKTLPGQGGEAINAVWEANVEGIAADFIIVVSASVDTESHDEVLFHWCANTDPGRDLHRHEHKIAFDATAKLPGDERNGHPVRDYPPKIEMDAATKDLVTRRWDEYGLD